jgi:leucyl/phenylalanyl-tRNA--protein transferase
MFKYVETYVPPLFYRRELSMRSVWKTLRAIKNGLKEGYRWFLQTFVLRLFVRPDVAVSCAFSAARPSSSEKVVATAMRCAASTYLPSPEGLIANYLLGMDLLGRHGTDSLEWKVYPERAIITPDSAKIPRSTKNYIKRNEFEIVWSRDFEGVLEGCQRQKWSWITPPLMEIYKELFKMGVARSLEAYQEGRLVGGHLGFTVGHTFAGMSSFHAVDRAGTVLWGTLTRKVMDGEIGMVDCGEQKPHFARYGAYVVPREEFVQRVVQGVIRSK